MWANTMNTNETEAVDPPAHVPDAATIARLANEFFAALPSYGAFPATSAEPASLTPENPGAVPVVGSPGSPAYIHNAAQPPLNPGLAPPEPSGLFSFPVVPAMQSAPASPAHLGEAADPAPWNAPASMPAVGDLFSLPGMTGMPLVLDRPVPMPSTTSPTIATDAATMERPAWLETVASFAGPFNAALSFPVTSDLFVMPGLPGAQSPPGAPAMPSSPPAQPGEASPAGVPNAGSAGQPTEVDYSPEMTPDLGRAKRPFDPYLIRRDFPILDERVHGRPLVWLDNAATTQKPNAVIDRISYFYRHENSNVHRAAHTLAARATDAYESAREKVRRFLNASSAREVVFVRGATEGINLVAQAWGGRHVKKDDEIVITWLEHHANIVPWQQLCAAQGARLRVAPVDDRGEVILEEYEKLLGPRTRLVAFTQVSNALGTVTPAREMVEMAHRHGARVLVDGAQSVAHMRTDVQALDCDFFVFSGHKIFAPTGIGVLYGKADILDNTPPWQGGGSMIVDVTFEKTVYQQAPARFEAGTGNIADAVGLGAALDYLDEVGIESVNRHEHGLLIYATAALQAIPGLRLIGTAREKAGVLSFVLDEFRTEDVGVMLNQEGIAVRSGHHCAQPILRRFGLESTVRPSLALYNTTEDIDALVAAILRMQAGRRHGSSDR
jgi:cysteine desulfurase/selenocysteine lyase